MFDFDFFFVTPLISLCLLTLQLGIICLGYAYTVFPAGNRVCDRSIDGADDDFDSKRAPLSPEGIVGPPSLIFVDKV